MRPEALVVAGPYRRIFLGTAVAGSCNDKRSFACQILPAFISCPGHIVAVDIVHFGMCGRTAFIRKDNIVRERSVETGRFIHIVPDTAYTQIRVEPKMFSPPFSYVWAAKIGIYCVSRPDGIDVNASIG